MLQSYGSSDHYGKHAFLELADPWVAIRDFTIGATVLLKDGKFTLFRSLNLNIQSELAEAFRESVKSVNRRLAGHFTAVLFGKSRVQAAEYGLPNLSVFDFRNLLPQRLSQLSRAVSERIPPFVGEAVAVRRTPAAAVFEPNSLDRPKFFEASEPMPDRRGGNADFVAKCLYRGLIKPIQPAEKGAIVIGNRSGHCSMLRLLLKLFDISCSANCENSLSSGDVASLTCPSYTRISFGRNHLRRGMTMKSCVGLLLLTLILSSPLAAIAQSETRQSAPAEEFDFSATIEPIPAVPTAFERVDSFFASVVGILYKGLFFKIAESHRPEIHYSGSERYIRFGGTDDDFRPIDAAAETEFESISVVELTQLSAAGRTLSGNAIVDGEEKSWSSGLISGKPVDYVDLKLPITVDGQEVKYGAKFIQPKADGPYFLVGPKRGLLLKDSSISNEEAKKLAENGDGWSTSTTSEGGIPLVVLWLFLGGVFFTLRMRFVNFWAFGHALRVVRGDYDNPEEDGEVTHAQALASALSATVGLGNISGVTIAMVAGGPGAFFWMMLAALFGMCSKFVECTLAQKYRAVKSDGTVLGGPMRYLRAGLAEKGFGDAGIALGVVFSIMCVLSSFGGGNMYQANQAADLFAEAFVGDSVTQLDDLNSQMATAAEQQDGVTYDKLRVERRNLIDRIDTRKTQITAGFGIALAVLVALVILGGIKRIGATAEKIVPSMCAIYILGCLVVIAKHLPDVPALFGRIVTEAFIGEAVGGGILGAIIVGVTGIQRAAFSNEAGVGSAAIAHSAAKTKEPVREGCVALLGPFLDTIVVCSMTALVILITGVWDNDALVVARGLNGTPLTGVAFTTELGSWFKYVLTLAVVLFAFSSIISWSYYGERAWEDLLGARSVPIYKLLTVCCVFIGAIVNLGSVLDFSDMMILSMAFPNILGAVILSGGVRKDLLDYWSRLKAGEFDVVNTASTASDAEAEG